MLIQEQVDRLREAVKAAQIRTERRSGGKKSRLRTALLKPLKMLCLSQPPEAHGITLPAGIQDTDLVCPSFKRPVSRMPLALKMSEVHHAYDDKNGKCQPGTLLCEGSHACICWLSYSGVEIA